MVGEQKRGRPPWVIGLRSYVSNKEMDGGQCEVCRHFFEDTFEDTFKDTFNDFSRLYMVLITFGDTFNSFCRHFYV